MTKESTPRVFAPGDGEEAGEALLARVAALGLPTVGHSRQGRAIFGGFAGFAEWAGEGPMPMRHAHTRAPLVVMGGIHGNEPSSVGAILDLAAAWSQVAAGGPVILVPALNPDGLAVNAKNSAANVDLNRNFAARNFTTTHQAGYDPGPAPLSEPETAAFAALIEQHRPWGVVAVHAPFACINHDGPARPWAEAVAAACGWPAQADIGYPTPGSLGSWLGVDRGLPVLTIELPPGPLQGFRAAALQALLAAVKWT
jgi:murein peptide amidase A